MNLGRSLEKARAHVKANANRFQRAYVLNVDLNGVYHADRLDSFSSENVPAVKDAIEIIRPVRVTNAMIDNLRTEARTAGDTEQVTLCERALEGDDEARKECACAIYAARAMAD